MGYLEQAGDSWRSKQAPDRQRGVHFFSEEYDNQMFAFYHFPHSYRWEFAKREPGAKKESVLACAREEMEVKDGIDSRNLGGRIVL